MLSFFSFLYPAFLVGSFATELCGAGYMVGSSNRSRLWYRSVPYQCAMARCLGQATIMRIHLCSAPSACAIGLVEHALGAKLSVWWRTPTAGSHLLDRTRDCNFVGISKGKSHPSKRVALPLSDMISPFQAGGSWSRAGEAKPKNDCAPCSRPMTLCSTLVSLCSRWSRRPMTPSISRSHDAKRDLVESAIV